MVERVGETSNKIWERCININLNGPFYLTRTAVEHFLTKETEQKGRIVNVCSLASVKGGTAGAAYTTSKHALLGLSRNTAWMYAKEGIQCNAVIPGGVMTNILANSKSVINEVGMQALKPVAALMPGLCEPVDVAQAILFLAGANGLNGAELEIDKGWSKG